MSTSRRDFLKNSTIVALAVGIPAGVTSSHVSAHSANSTHSAEGLLGKQDFIAQLHTEFLIYNGGTKVKARLMQVSDLPGPSRKDREGFSLIFDGPRNRPLKQSTYLLEHAKLGQFTFLLVPIFTKDRGGNHYEAVINRLYP